MSVCQFFIDGLARRFHISIVSDILHSLAYYIFFLLASFTCATDEEDKGAWTKTSQKVSRGMSDESNVTTDEVKNTI